MEPERVACGTPEECHGTHRYLPEPKEADEETLQDCVVNNHWTIRPDEWPRV